MSEYKNRLHFRALSNSEARSLRDSFPLKGHLASHSGTLPSQAIGIIYNSPNYRQSRKPGEPEIKVQTTPIVWSFENAAGYVRISCENLNIPFAELVSNRSAYYFPLALTNGIVRGFSCADMELYKWYKNRSFWKVFLNGQSPTRRDPESSVIQKMVEKAIAAS